MTQILLSLSGSKLPGEAVWCDEFEMYELHQRFNIELDVTPITTFIITDVREDGIVIDTLH